MLAPLAFGIIGIGGWELIRPEPLPDPKLDFAFGCYVSPNAPSWRIAINGLNIIQKQPLTLPFTLSRTKSGFAISLDDPLDAEGKEGRFGFKMGSRKGGRLVFFTSVLNGKTYHVFNEAQLNRFDFATDDGTVLIYRRVDGTMCGSQV